MPALAVDRRIEIAALILLSLVSFIVSYGLVGISRRYAWAAEVVDLPNERTLHKGRIARGGGLAIVLLCLVALAAAATWWEEPYEVAGSLFFVTLALGFLGWIDDHYDLPIGVRILAQFLVAGGFVAWLDPVSTVVLGEEWSLRLGIMSIPLTLIWVVWMANLYNFMDGIDGLAGLQGMIGAATMSLWFYWAGSGGLVVVCLVLCSACAGFLVWNWSPARVFMGDVGSVTLGGLFAALSVVASTRYDIPITAFAILFSVFIGDATLTLARRIARREPFWQAHRSHYYQRAVRFGLSHSAVAGAAGLIAVLEACLATLVVAGLMAPWSGLAAAIAILAVALFGVIRLEHAE